MRALVPGTFEERDCALFLVVRVGIDSLRIDQPKTVPFTNWMAIAIIHVIITVFGVS